MTFVHGDMTLASGPLPGRLAESVTNADQLGASDPSISPDREDVAVIANQSPLSFSTWRKIARATWRPRKDPMIWATVDIDATRLLHYIEDLRAATGCHVTPAHLVGR